MTSLQSMREFISLRLNAAAEEIYRQFEETIVRYEKELDRQRRLLTACRTPLHLPFQGISKLYWIGDVNPSNQSAVKQEEPESPQIKGEQEEFSISHGEEQLDPKHDADAISVVVVKNENEEEYEEINSITVTIDQNQENSALITNEEPNVADHSDTSERSHVGDVAMSQTEDQSEVERIPNINDRKTPAEEEHSSEDPEDTFGTTDNLNPSRKISKHSCEECEQSFSYKSSLTIHKRTLKGGKTFCCRECDKRFNRTSHFLSHMKTHSGEKPYPCTECDKSFSRVSDVISHMRTHSREKPVSCEHCEMSFPHQFSLSKHIKKHKTK